MTKNVCEMKSKFDTIQYIRKRLLPEQITPILLRLASFIDSYSRYPKNQCYDPRGRFRNPFSMQNPATSNSKAVPGPSPQL